MAKKATKILKKCLLLKKKLIKQSVDIDQKDQCDHLIFFGLVMATT